MFFCSLGQGGKFAVPHQRLTTYQLFLSKQYAIIFYFCFHCCYIAPILVVINIPPLYNICFPFKVWVGFLVNRRSDKFVISSYTCRMILENIYQMAKMSEGAGEYVSLGMATGWHAIQDRDSRGVAWVA